MTPHTLASPESLSEVRAVRSCPAQARGKRSVGIFAAMTTGIDMDHHRCQVRLVGCERVADLFGYLVTLPGREILIDGDMQFRRQGVSHPAQTHLMDIFHASNGTGLALY